ncbi:hypothetical protein P7C71_g397, partial [Lecanoromycetidae sp. Uapishka_2]
MSSSADAKPADYVLSEESQNAETSDEKPRTSSNARHKNTQVSIEDDDGSDIESLSDPDDGPTRRPDVDSLYGSKFGKSLPSKTLEERITRAPKQVGQIIQYTKLMEDRVQALEAEVQVLKADRTGASVVGPPNDTIDHDKLSPPASVSKAGRSLASLEPYKLRTDVNRVPDAEYRKLHLAESEKRFVIDVMFSETTESISQYDIAGASHATNDDLMRDTVEARDRTPSIVAMPAIVSALRPATEKPMPRPKRMRINSKRLLIELFKVTEQSKDMSVTQFLAPFQLFTLYEQQIRNHTKTIEVLCRGEVPTRPESDSLPEPIEGIPRESGTLESRVAQDADQDPPTLQSTSDMETQAGSSSAQIRNKATAASDEVFEVHDEDFDEIDKYDTPLVGSSILEIMETCQVSRQEAVKALKADELPQYAILTLLGAMTPERRRQVEIEVAKLLLPEWKALIAFLNVDLESTLKMCSLIRDGMLSSIAYADLSHLYKPGDIVISTQNKRLQAYTVIATSGGRELLVDTVAKKNTVVDRYGLDPPPLEEATVSETFYPRGRYSPFVVDCWYCDFDGAGFECITKAITIAKYDDIKAVTSLAVYPMSLHDDRSRDLMAVLIARGTKFVELCSDADIGHRQYSGRTLDDTPEEIDSEVIIDCQMAATVQPEHRPDKSEWMPEAGILDLTEPDEREIMEPKEESFKCKNKDCSICKDYAKVFFNDQDFNRQKSKEYISPWTFLDRSREGSDLGRDELALLPPRLFGFVLRSRKWARLDIDKITKITNEGNGFKKLVLKKGYAEIVQALVETHFKDPDPEAEKVDHRHNVDLVRVFLRVLEYYAGILFLTTNRVGTFDDAFKSRIHMSLYYPELNLESTLQVWKMNIDRTQENMKNLVIESEDIMGFAEEHYERAKAKGSGRWNGRQIRNAFQTAIALAEWDAKEKSIKAGKLKPAILSWEWFKQVANASADFDAYLHLAHGSSENQRAKIGQERADWDITPKQEVKSVVNRSGRNRRDYEDGDERPSKQRSRQYSNSEDEGKRSEKNGRDGDDDNKRSYSHKPRNRYGFENNPGRDYFGS